MIDSPQEQLEQVRAIVHQRLRGGEVAAFGSRVSGHAEKFLDLDLMIEADGTVPWQLLADLPIPVDVVDWSTCSEQFRRQVDAALERIV